jgi:hypothetical protein
MYLGVVRRILPEAVAAERSEPPGAAAQIDFLYGEALPILPWIGDGPTDHLDRTGSIGG